MPEDTMGAATMPVEAEAEAERNACSECGAQDDDDGTSYQCECYECNECETLHNPEDTPECGGCSGHRTRLNDAGARYTVHVCRDNCQRDCFYCEGCGETHDGRSYTQCGACNQCTENHGCFYCSACNEYAESGCSECERCNGCECECSEGMGIRFVNNPIRFHPGKAVAANPSRRAISAEVELAKGGDVRVDRVVNTWSMSVVKDGSVDDGCEINTAPASGDEWIRQITELGAALNASNADVDKRCGLHVHIDARDYRWQDMGKLLWLYQHLETTVFQLVPPDRRGSRWAMKRGEQVRTWLGNGEGSMPAAGYSSAQWKERIMGVVAEASFGTHWNYGRLSSHTPTSAMIREAIGDRPEAPYRGQYRFFQESAVDNSWHAPGECSGCDEERARHAERGRNRDAINAEAQAKMDRDTARYVEQLAAYEAAVAKYTKNFAKRAKQKRQLMGVFRPQRINSTKPKRKKTSGHQGLGGDRYYALNLQAWFKHGTVEVRLHGGTANAEKITHWGTMWACILDYAKKQSIEGIAEACKSEPWELLQSIMPTDDMREFFTSRMNSWS